MKQYRRRHIVLTVFLGLIFLALVLYLMRGFAFSHNHPTKAIFADRQISILVADSPHERSLGLSNTSSLAADAMVFLFDKPGEYPFWMKDMNYPIDIFWFDANQELIHIAENISPNTYPKSFGHGFESQFVIETNAGYAQKHDISLGNTFKILK